jgi:outer membrane protein OmpA-like peptidoglycan-associated protein
MRFIAVLLLAAILYAPKSAEGQRTRRLERKAEASFKAGNYYNAAKLYAAILYDSPLVTASSSLVYPFKPVSSGHTKKIKESRKSLVQYQLAESYRLYYHFKEALPQYEQYIQSRDTRFPLAGLWYGTCLLATDQPEKAITVFNAFLQKHRTIDSFAQKARLGIADANFRISSRLLRPEAIVTKINTVLSEDGSNFAIQKMDNGSFWFTSSRHEIDKQKEKTYPVRLYSMNGNIPEKITGIADEDMNTGAASLSADGLTLYFTGWKEDKKSLPVYYRIYAATRTSINAKWNRPVALSASVNVPGFNAKQPFVTSDNRHLFFVSDRPGGYGKYDIWLIKIDSGQIAGIAFNAGNQVNTDGDEASPFYDLDSAYLYYSSNGKIGMGGMDIYKINGDPLTNGWVANAINLGSPVNSVKDDLYYFKEKKSDTAYISSDRASGCCLEIFKAVQIHYKDSGVPVTKSEPLPQKITPPVVQEDTTNKRLIDSINTVTVERMHVNYNFASAKIRKADKPKLDHVIQLLKRDPTLHILIASFTDCIGSKEANIRLSRKRSESVRQYLFAKGIDVARINIDFFGKKHFILACKEDGSYNKENQIANRRSDLIVTHDPDPKWQPTGEELDIPGRLNKLSSSLNPPVMGATTENEQKRATLADTQGLLNATEKHTTINKNATDNVREKNIINAEKQNSSYRATRKKMIANKREQDSVLKNSRKKAMAQAPGTKTVKPVPEAVEKPGIRKNIDSLHTAMKITELLDFIPKLKNAAVINEMTRRTPRKSFEIYTTSDSVRIELYDNGVFDNDSVSVIYNKQLTIYKQMLLTNRPIRFYVKLDPDQARNEMIFFAENLGITPPNSALMIITDGDNKRTEINVSSDLHNNAVIYFIKVKK